VIELAAAVDVEFEAEDMEEVMVVVAIAVVVAAAVELLPLKSNGQIKLIGVESTGHLRWIRDASCSKVNTCGWCKILTSTFAGYGGNIASEQIRVYKYANAIWPTAGVANIWAGHTNSKSVGFFSQEDDSRTHSEQDVVQSASPPGAWGWS
jgi:hypothetical protein